MPAATSSHSSSGEPHPAGEPAAHPHDRDRLVGRARPRRGTDRAAPPRWLPVTSARSQPRQRGRRSGSRRPAWPAAAARSTAPSRLRSSTAVSESKPRSVNAALGRRPRPARRARAPRRPGPGPGPAPTCSCSAAGSPASRCGQRAAGRARRRGRAAAGPAPRSSAGSMPVRGLRAQRRQVEPRPATSSAASSASGRVEQLQALRSSDSGATPIRASRARSASSSVRRSCPLASRPQSPGQRASRAGRGARRRCASASRKALAAA